MSKLVELLIAAHVAACHRDNSSTLILKSAFDSNGGDLIKSVTAALMSIGGLHAPIKQTYVMLRKILEGKQECDVICFYELVPGFGSSFIKEDNDPLLESLRQEFIDNHLRYYNIGCRITSHLKQKTKHTLYPNLAFYTACVAHIEGHGVQFCERILIEARVPEWINILQHES